MIQLATRLNDVKHLAVLGLAMVGLALGITMALPAESASAVSCRVYTPAQDLYEAGSRTSQTTYFVPGSAKSGCKDINVRNIKNLNVAGDYCATFKVQFFPTWGAPYYGQSKTVCSKDPDGSGPANGPVVPIATNVLNGTEYRVWYQVENQAWKHSFQVVD